MDYQLTPADKLAVPAAFFSTPRYLGYREEDYKKPYAHFFQEKVIPIQPQVREALIGGPLASGLAPRLSWLVDDLAKPGYQAMENGYTVNEDGHLVVCALTDMPGVTAEMWDWWFWWHAVEPSRYKLWHPESHVYSVFTEDRSQIKGLTDRQRAWGNGCYINEYLGADYVDLKVGILNPAQMGFDTSRPGETYMVARGGVATAPVAALWLVHQIRETPTGSEMRSRFFFNDVRVHRGLPAHSVTTIPGKIMTLPGVSHLADAVLRHTKPAKLQEFGPALLAHCGQEMNHLASFLAQLYAEFAAESRA